MKKDEIAVKLTPTEMFDLVDAVDDSNYSVAERGLNYLIFEFESTNIKFFKEEPSEIKESV